MMNIYCDNIMKRVFNWAYRKFSTQKPMSIYKRELPIVYIRLNSPEGKIIFKEALTDGSMQCYFPLAQQFITQAQPETCGPTSLVMVLNSLNVDPGKQWKGIWRWYTQDNLNLITKQILSRGVDLQSWTHLAQHNHLDVMTFYHPKGHGPDQDTHSCDIHRQWVYRTSAYDTFRDCVLSSSRRDGFILTINHSRKRMGQTGDGHYSPVGGYNKNRSLVLMLDVARYKYPSYWCDTRKLFDSIEDMDKATNKPRGFVLISRKQESGGCRTTSNIDFQYVNLFHRSIIKLSENLINQTQYEAKFVESFLGMFDDELRSLVVYYLFQFECCNTRQQKIKLFQEIEKHPIYQIISRLEEGEKQLKINQMGEPRLINKLKLKSLANDFTMGKYKEVVTIMLLSLPKSILNFQSHKHSQYLSQNIKLFRKCFVIYRQEPKDEKFE